MTYSTKGTVQVDVHAGTTLSVGVFIAPAQSHTVTVEKNAFIVLLSHLVTSAPTSTAPGRAPDLNAMVLAKDTKFTCDQSLNDTLILAATQSLSVELIFDDPTLLKITGLKIPGLVK
jgi:hypothetical protein